MSNGKHLGPGSKLPELPDDGLLRLYSMRFCPYAQRVHLVLDAKKIKYHTIFVNLTEKPEWLTSKSPLGKVPALELPGEKEPLIESLVIADYLDEKYPQVPLHSKDPLRKAQDRILIERFSGVTSALYRLFMSVDGPPPGTLTDIVNGLDVYEKELRSRKTPFFGGNTISMLDLMIWPWCERSDMIRILVGDKYELDKERFQHLLKWRDLMKKEEAVKCSFVSAENHAKFLEGRRVNEPNYDMLVNPAKRARTIF